MTNKVEVEVFGLKELDATMKDLVTQIQGRKGFEQNPLRTAVRKGADVIMEKAVSNAKAIDDPSTATDISKAIYRTPIPLKMRDEYTVRGASLEGYDIGVRARRKKSRFTSSGFAKGWTAIHWHFLEFGTVKMSAQPFMRPAAHSERDKAIRTFAESLKKSLVKIRAKLKKENDAKVRK